MCNFDIFEPPNYHFDSQIPLNSFHQDPPNWQTKRFWICDAQSSHLCFAQSSGGIAIACFRLGKSEKVLCVSSPPHNQ